MSYLLAASLRCQASSVAGVTGKISAQRLRGMSRASAANHTRSAGPSRTRVAWRRAPRCSCRSTSEVRPPRLVPADCPDRPGRVSGETSGWTISSSTRPANHPPRPACWRGQGQPRNRLFGDTGRQRHLREPEPARQARGLAWPTGSQPGSAPVSRIACTRGYPHRSRTATPGKTHSVTGRNPIPVNSKATSRALAFHALSGVNRRVDAQRGYMLVPVDEWEPPGPAQLVGALSSVDGDRGNGHASRCGLPHRGWRSEDSRP